MWAPVVLARYWLFQGTLYMNAVERAHRFALEAAFALASWLALSAVAAPSLRLAAALALGHTASMVFNGHLFALIKHDLYWFGFYRRWEDFAAYVDALQERLVRGRHPGLERAEVYGSLTRGRFGDASDLDLRFMARPGLRAGLAVAHLVWRERLRALFAGFPLDLYMFRSDTERARKLDLARERPVVLYASGRAVTSIRTCRSAAT